MNKEHLSNYYVSFTGKLCVTKRIYNDAPILFFIIGCVDENWFYHVEVR